eukprot:457145-Hanusia_phi.AAC.1
MAACHALAPRRPARAAARGRVQSPPIWSRYPGGHGRREPGGPRTRQGARPSVLSLGQPPLTGPSVRRVTAGISARPS